MSILSNLPDGMGYHYGFRGDDHRQINIRRSPSGDAWDIYVGGEWIGQAKTKERAEKLALEWMDENPCS